MVTLTKGNGKIKCLKGTERCFTRTAEYILESGSKANAMETARWTIQTAISTMESGSRTNDTATASCALSEVTSFRVSGKMTKCMAGG